MFELSNASPRIPQSVIGRHSYSRTIYILLVPNLLYWSPSERQAHADPGSVEVAAKLAPSMEEFHGSRESGAENAYKLGASVGAGLQVGVTEQLGAQLELLYATRGTDVALDDRTVGTFYLTYFEVPVLVRFAWRVPGLASGGQRSPLSAHLIAGGAMSRLLGAVREDGSGTLELNRGVMSNSDISAVAGLGLTWDVTPIWAASFEVRYDAGFINAFPDAMDGQETKNRAILFTFGVSYTLNDGDGDGVISFRDRCPGEAEYWNGSADHDGCADDDPDRDSIVGTKDACPREAEEMNEYEDDDGCPDAQKDKDGDGIADKDDRCVDQAFPYNKALDHDRRGCPPDFDLVRVGHGELEVTPPLEFDWAEDQLTPNHERVLAQVVVLLRDYYPNMKLLVEGHSDSKLGPRDRPEHNIDKSRNRAQAVITYLATTGGIDGTRLEMKAYGADNPRSVETADGRQRSNRRVDLIILANPKP